MSSPTHVRNDYRIGHLQPLSESGWDRGSRYEYFVSLRYGRVGIPKGGSADVTFDAVGSFFTNSKGTGLADIAHRSAFSPGSLPDPVRVMPGETSTTLIKELTAVMPFSEPSIEQVDIECLLSRRPCLLQGPYGRIASYRLDGDQRIVFELDRTSFASAARQLVPLAVTFSRSLINHIFRARVGVEQEGSELQIRLEEPAIRSAKLLVLSEDVEGRRRPLRTIPVESAAPGDLLARLPLGTETLPKALIVFIEGESTEGEPLFAAATLEPKAPQPDPVPITEETDAADETTLPLPTRSTAEKKDPPTESNSPDTEGEDDLIAPDLDTLPQAPDVVPPPP